MASSVGSDSIDENKPEGKEFLIHILGEGTCQIKNMVYPVVSDSTEIKLECKDLLIDIPAKKARPAATDIIKGILARNNEFPQHMEPPPRWPESCIYMVPKKLRDVNIKAYSPKLISIGPLHHGQKELKDMDSQKLLYFNEFFSRNEKITPTDLAEIIKKNEEKIRHCYAADFSILSSEDFISMILLDAIFIIELFLRNATIIIEHNLRDDTRPKHALHDLVASAVPNLLPSVPSVGDKSKVPDDYMFSDKWLSYHLRLDLLLLENQLPFFILEKLWEKSNCYYSSEQYREEQQNAKEEEKIGDPTEIVITSFLAKLCKHSNCYSVGSDHRKEEEKSGDPTEKHAKEDTSFLALAFAYFYELHPEHEQKPSQKEVKHFSDMLRRCTNSGKEVKYTRESKDEEKVKHFTDMLRYFFYSPEEQKEADGKCMELIKKFIDKFREFFCFCFCFCSEDESEDGGSIKHLYSATQLDEAGVKFKRVKDRPLLDIKFNKNICLQYCPFLNCSWLLNCLPCFTCFKFMQPFLEVPTFEVNDETECVFRNLMAFEQCHSQSDSYPICNYILLLDRLINSKEDVGLLVDEKVVVNFLGSNKRVATLVNDLCLEIVEPEKSQFTDLSKRLNKYYAKCWNKNMASLTRLYFRDFWRGTATVVGLIVLVFTLWNFHRLLIKGQKF